MEIEDIMQEEGSKDNLNDPGATIEKELVSMTSGEQGTKDNPVPEVTEKSDVAAKTDHKGKKKPKKVSDKELEILQTENAELKEKYLRLYSEFENYRRRTAKEKLELIKTAGEDILLTLLPVIDDFERALSSAVGNMDNSSLEGIMHIYNKLKNLTELKGLKVMMIEKGMEFNAEIHEAITKIPVEEESLKGRIVEVLEKGYYLHDKVIRFAKVVMGS